MQRDYKRSHYSREPNSNSGSRGGTWRPSPSCRTTSYSSTVQAHCLLRAIAAGNKGFWQWETGWQATASSWLTWVKPPKNRLPSYSTLRRALLHTNYEQYCVCLTKFFDVQPNPGETIGLDGKVLKGSYQLEDDNPLFRLPPSNYVSQRLYCRTGLALRTIPSRCQNKRALKQYLS